MPQNQKGAQILLCGQCGSDLHLISRQSIAQIFQRNSLDIQFWLLPASRNLVYFVTDFGYYVRMGNENGKTRKPSQTAFVQFPTREAAICAFGGQDSSHWDFEMLRNQSAHSRSADCSTGRLRCGGVESKRWEVRCGPSTSYYCSVNFEQPFGRNKTITSTPSQKQRGQTFPHVARLLFAEQEYIMEISA